MKPAKMYYLRSPLEKLFVHRMANARTKPYPNIENDCIVVTVIATLGKSIDSLLNIQNIGNSIEKTLTFRKHTNELDL